MKIGVLIYTYNRTDDAKINMELICNVWQKNKYFRDIEIIHAYNGNEKWYPKKYLENKLIRMKNSWHFQGAADLIDAGIKKFKADVDYVIILAADTWLIKPVYVERLLEKMKKDNLYIATCPWGLPERNELKDVGMAVDFFIVDLKSAGNIKCFLLDMVHFTKNTRIYFYTKGEIT